MILAGWPQNFLPMDRVFLTEQPPRVVRVVDACGGCGDSHSAWAFLLVWEVKEVKGTRIEEKVVAWWENE